MIEFISLAGVAELADALDSKSSALRGMRVQVPPPAQRAPSNRSFYNAKMTGNNPSFLIYSIVYFPPDLLTFSTCPESVETP